MQESCRAAGFGSEYGTGARAQVRVPGPSASIVLGDVRIRMRKSYPARFGAQRGDCYQVHRCRTHCGNGVSAQGSVPSDVVLLGRRVPARVWD